ncbi:MAG: Stk1 family PASTA domain-containing Ser/Thr kinase [Firmicutes bacterium]|nr:Stk1 family PASTA domain-containing Ser/Thr kinase [Bacillota bacterium]
MLEKGSVINKRYRIIEKIGEGGMAIVYKAMDEKLEREVTFKVLREDFIGDEEFIKRFVREARAAAKLSNANIVNAYDVGNEGNTYYIVMEYIDGFTLKDLIRSKAPFGVREAAEIGIQIASALREAHSHGIVHRDIKPENILITRSGKDGMIKVTDFGIAKAASSATGPVDYMGSVHYFSPEQAKGEKVDNRSDIYSLGIVLYEMVTGELPFDGETPVALAMKHLKEPLPDIKKKNPNVSKALVAIINKATNKDVRNRYQSAKALEDDLKRAIGMSINDTSDVDRKYDDRIENTGKVSSENGGGTVVMGKKDVKKINKNSKKKQKGSVLVPIITAVILAAVVVGVIAFAGMFIYNTLYEDTVKLPNYVNMTFEEANRDASSRGLLVERSNGSSENVPVESVFKQSPAPGERVKKDSQITLYVSTGTNMLEVPDFEGLTKNEADALAAESDLTVRVSEYVHSDYAFGSIVSQDPAAGELVAANSVIDVKISQGKKDEMRAVPDVSGQTEEVAKEMLQDLGFIPYVIKEYSSTVESGIVISQGVAANEQKTTGSNVQIVVSLGKNPNSTDFKVEVTTLDPVVDIEIKPEVTTRRYVEPVQNVETKAQEETEADPEAKDKGTDVEPDPDAKDKGKETPAETEVPTEPVTREIIHEETVAPLGQEIDE